MPGGPGGLDEPPGEPDRSVAVWAYVLAVFAGGVVALAFVLTRPVPVAPWSVEAKVGCALLAGLLMLGELRPLAVPRGDDETDRITVSSTFATALALVGPLALAMAVQAVAVALDDLGKRRSPKFVLFNIGQYLVTLFGTRLAFALLTGHAFAARSATLAPRDLLPALLAGATYFVLNNGLVAYAVALDGGVNPWAILREDIRVQGITSCILLGLAPVAGLVATTQPLMLLLLMLPIVGVHHNAQLVLRRQHEALHDPLTDLPNREYLRRRLERAMEAADSPGGRFAIMVLDLDHFKEINDTLGHHVGDQVIRQVAARLQEFLPDAASVARLGGDEFAIMCPDVRDLDDVALLGQAICARLQQPVEVDGVRLSVAASIGIAVAPEHADNVGTLLKRADIALYRAKSRRGEVLMYGHEIDGHTVERLSLLSDLYTGLENDEFVLHFQPIVETGSGRVVGAEALKRWLHPQQGLVSPDVFIPLAENTNLIGALTRMAITRSTEALKGWLEAGHDLTVSVNLSARLLSDLDLPDSIAQILAERGVPASRLAIEVTESTIMSDPKRAIAVLHRLREMGVTLAIDDYGTGYSSLAYLRRLAVHEIKIDKSFVQQMVTDDNSAIIVRSTIELAHNLGLTVTAEGVEDLFTLEALRSLGCDHAQGFHISRPVPAPALGRWLAARTPVDGPHAFEVLR